MGLSSLFSDHPEAVPQTGSVGKDVQDAGLGSLIAERLDRIREESVILGIIAEDGRTAKINVYDGSQMRS